jgi:hypothetical protein
VSGKLQRAACRTALTQHHLQPVHSWEAPWL